MVCICETLDSSYDFFQAYRGQLSKEQLQSDFAQV